VSFIIKEREPGQFLDDLELDRDQREQVKQVIERVVRESFGSAPSCDRTEARRRVRICLKWFGVMWAELGYTIGRWENAIPTALACELAGIEYAPQENLGRGYKKHKKGSIPWAQL